MWDDSACFLLIASIPSPPAASLRDIIEQEQSKAASEAQFVVKVCDS